MQAPTNTCPDYYIFDKYTQFYTRAGIYRHSDLTKGTETRRGVVYGIKSQ